MKLTIFFIWQLVISFIILYVDWKKDKSVKENIKLKAPFLITMVVIMALVISLN